MTGRAVKRLIYVHRSQQQLDLSAFRLTHIDMSRPGTGSVRWG